LIGYASCKLALGYALSGSHIGYFPLRQNQGYGSETLNLILTIFIRTTPAHNISLWMADWNTSARRFADKNGFRESGCMRHDGLREGKYYDLILMGPPTPRMENKEGRLEPCRLKEN
jgi:RimJ/RimL family protein N-acetyltransferase